MVKRLLILIVAILCASSFVNAVNTGAYWALMPSPNGEAKYTVTTTGTTITMNNTSVDKIYVDVFSSQKMYYSFQNRVPSTSDAYVAAGGHFDSQCYVLRNAKFGLKADSATSNVVVRRYYLVMP